jgi:hypothetical protein
MPTKSFFPSDIAATKAYADAAAQAAQNAAQGYADSIASGSPATYRLSTWTGSTLDARIDNAKSTAVAQVNIPILMFDVSGVINASHAVVGGVKFQGSNTSWPTNMLSAGGHASAPITLKLGTSIGIGPLAAFTWTGTVYDGGFMNIAFDGTGTSNAQVFHAPLGGANAYGFLFHNLSFKNIKHKWGNEAGFNGATAVARNSFTVTGCVFSGFSYMDAGDSIAAIFGGSDCAFAFTKCNWGGDGATSTHAFPVVVFDGMTKTTVCNVFITAGKYLQCIEVNGAALYCHELTFTGCTFEGQNGNVNPAYGYLFKKTGTGNVTVRDCGFGYANKGAPGTAAIAAILVQAGIVYMDGCGQRLTSGHTSPATQETLAYVSTGATLRIFNTFANDHQGSEPWAGAIPTVRYQSTSGQIIHDATVNSTA